MLYVNKDIQKNIVILAFKKELIYQKYSLFTDGNASAGRTQFFNNINDLDKLNWKCLEDKYWNNYKDGKREIMAEVLVPEKVNIQYLKKIYCNSYIAQQKLQKFLNRHQHLNLGHIQIEVNEKIYF